MNEPPSSARLYDEKEMRRLLKRATELQKEEGSTPLPGGGMSLAELEEIAGEAGIDPRYLRRAAAELSTHPGDATGWERLAGESLTLSHEAVVPGELSPDGFERMVAAIQGSAREHGQPTLLGRTLTWQAETAGKSRTMLVTVTSRKGETHVRAEERLHQMATGLFVGTTVGGGSGLGVGVGLPLGLKLLGSTVAAVAFPLATVGLCYLGARGVYRGIVRRRRAVLGNLVEAVARAAAESIAEERRLPPG